ncbi:hypothetical protein H2201_004707 [Coniosporium apollinis]|uniref:Lipocalin-like domain-containing protein n=1 Tax=Coniosporium apollinis TaxID=61459 RepID=A0ABQ9NTL5_9PEZI|nr:hypothetical protein H2201_004707 [Coniosporium apollinis]
MPPIRRERRGYHPPKLRRPPIAPTHPAELRAHLVGAWTLVQYLGHPTPRSKTQKSIFPMTRYCQGMLLYTPDGYVSLQLSTPGQAVFGLEGAGEGEWAEAGRRCVAYAGGYSIGEEWEEEVVVLEGGEGAQGERTQNEGVVGNGVPANAMPANGVPVNGVPVNGVPGNPVPANAVLANGVPGQPLPGQGVPGGRGGEARRMKMVLQLRHEMRLADLPQSRGSFQIQRWRFEKDGKVLVLTGEPTEVRVAGAPNGKRDGTVSTKMDSDWRIPEMRWRKMGSNAVDMPPRPQSVFERPPSIVPQMAPIPRVHRVPLVLQMPLIPQLPPMPQMSQMPQMHNGSTGNGT